MKSCKDVVGLSLLLTAMAAIGLPASANLEVRPAASRPRSGLRRSDLVGGGHQTAKCTLAPQHRLHAARNGRVIPG